LFHDRIFIYESITKRAKENLLLLVVVSCVVVNIIMGFFNLLVTDLTLAPVRSKQNH